MSETGLISGSARKARVPAKWVKKPGDERPCMHAGCEAEGHYIPYLTIRGKTKKTRHVVVLLPIVLCTEHAVTDPKEFVPSTEAVADLEKQLGDEPDLDTTVVQYFGNTRCKVDHARERASEKAGVYERRLDDEGRPITMKIG